MKIPAALLLAILLSAPTPSTAQVRASVHFSGEDNSDKASAGACAKVSQLLASDPSAAAAEWLHFLASISKTLETAGENSSSQYAEMQSQLMAYLVEHGASFPAMMAFLSKINASPAGEGFSTWEESLGDSLEEKYWSFPQVLDEGQEQHVFQTECLRHLVRFMKANAKATPLEARPELAAYALYQFQSSYRYQEFWNDRAAAVRWADDELKPLHPLLADAMIIAILGSDHSRLNAGQQDELRRRLLNFATSQELGPIEKASVLAQVLAPDMREKADSAVLVKAVAEDALAFMTPHRSLAGRKTLRFLQELTEYSSLSKEEAARLSSAFRASRLGGDKADDADGETASLSDIRLNLAIRAADLPEISRLIKSSRDAFKGRLEVELKLWQAGQGELAASLIPAADQFTPHAGYYFVTGLPSYFMTPDFTKEIEAKLPDWLQTIHDPAQRYRMECTISCLDDAKGRHAPQENRGAREKRLTSRFAAEGSQVRAARMETLAALTYEDGSLLRAEMAPLVKGEDLGGQMALRWNNSADTDASFVSEALIRRELKCRTELDGDASYLVDQVKSISAAGNARMSGWDMRQDLHSWFAYHASLLCWKIVQAPPEMKERLLKDVRSICESFLGCPDRYSQTFGPGLAIMAHAAGGAGAELDQWRENLPQNLRDAYDFSRNSYGLPNNARIVKGYALTQPGAAPLRREILRRFLCDQATVARELHDLPWQICYLMDFEVFNKDDLFGALDDLPKDLPLRPRFFAVKAFELASRFRDFDASAKAFDEADEMAKATGKPGDVAYVKVARAKIMVERLNKTDEAEELLEDIDTALLDSDQKGWVEDFRKKHPGH